MRRGVNLPTGDDVGRLKTSLYDILRGTASAQELAVGSGSTLIGFRQDSNDAVVRTVEAKLRDIVSVKDFGATGDGVTDDTLSIQAAIASADLVFIPEGTYIFTQIDIQRPITLFGEGPASVLKVKTSSSSIPIYAHAPTSAGISGVILRDFSLDGNSQNCQLDAGGIQLNTVRGFLVENIYIHDLGNPGSAGSGGVNGVSVSVGTTGWAATFGTIRNCFIEKTTKAGVNVSSGCVGVVVDGNIISACGGNGSAPGIQVNGASHTKVTRNHIVGCEGVGIFVNTSASGDATSTIIDGNTVLNNGQGASVGDGIVVTNTTATKVGPTIISNNVVDGNGVGFSGYGILCQNNKALNLIGNHVVGHDYSGIQIDDCDDVSISGNVCRNNDQGAVAAGGIQLVDTCSRIFIASNQCYDDQGVKTQDHGIKFDTGTMSDVTVIDNACEGNSVSGIYFTALPTKLSARFAARVSTASGYLFAATLPTSQAYHIDVRCVARNSTDAAAYHKSAAIYRASGAAVQAGATAVLAEMETTAGWGLTIGPNANTLEVLVSTGASSADWSAEINVLSV